MAEDIQGFTQLPPSQGVATTPVANAQPEQQQRPDLQMLRVKSNEMLDEEEANQAKSQKLLDTPAPAAALASHIEAQFRIAERAKNIQTDLMMDSLRRRKGEYSPGRMAEIKRQGGTEIFMKITEVQCLNAEAWLGDVVLNPDERPYALKPTPKSDLPGQLVEQVVQDTLAAFDGIEFQATEEAIRAKAQEIKEMILARLNEEAKQRADKMSDLIDDEFTEGGFLDELEDAISDMVSVGTGILKGPYFQMTKSLEWLEASAWAPSITEIPRMKFKRVDPLNFFPSAGATTPADAAFLCEVDEFRRRSLSEMIGIQGWSDENITKLLTEYPRGIPVLLRTDSEKAMLENRQADAVALGDDRFKGIWYCGEASGTMLADWGLTGVTPGETYEVIALKVGPYVVHCRINWHPLGSRPYHKSVYKPVKGSFWGQGVPELVSDCQDTCNATARAMINNLAIASGPQVVINNVDQLADGQDVMTMYPWKIWQYNDPARTGKTPMEFYQPNLNTTQLLEVYHDFLDQSYQRSGVPKVEPATSGEPATSLSIRLNQSSRMLKKTISNLDRFIIRPSVENAFTWNMLHIDDDSIKGDVRVVASGAMGLFVKEQRQLRLNDMLRMTANPVDMSIIKAKGRATLLRSAVQDLDIDVDEVVPTKAEIEREEQAALAQAQAAAEQQASMAAAGGPVPSAV